MPMPRTWLRFTLLCATVLLHVAALLAFLSQSGARHDTPDAAAMELVWIRALPPKLPRPPKPPEAPPLAAVAPPQTRPVKAPPRPRAVVPRKTPVETSDSTLVAVPAVPAGQAAPEAPAGEPAPFDHEGALQTARKIAREVDPVAPGTKYNETRDEKLGRAIASAKRQSCLGGNAKGNLLTPLMWLMEKKDSGCKF